MFGLFKTKAKPTNPYSKEAEPERYVGKPLLVLLENFVLHSIGELSPDKDALMARVVQKAYGGGDSWVETLKRELDLGASIEANLKQLWDKNQGTARQEAVELHPVQFAKMIADTNFAPLIRPSR